MTAVVLKLSGSYDVLQRIREAREPVTIRTSLRTFDNMVLKELTETTATFIEIEVP